MGGVENVALVGTMRGPGYVPPGAGSLHAAPCGGAVVRVGSCEGSVCCAVAAGELLMVGSDAGSIWRFAMRRLNERYRRFETRQQS